MMKRAEMNALRRLASSGEAGADLRDVPDGQGLLPTGRLGAVEQTLIGLRCHGLVRGSGGGRWWITEAGVAALAAPDEVLLLKMPSDKSVALAEQRVLEAEARVAAQIKRIEIFRSGGYTNQLEMARRLLATLEAVLVTTRDIARVKRAAQSRAVATAAALAADTAPDSFEAALSARHASDGHVRSKAAA